MGHPTYPWNRWHDVDQFDPVECMCASPDPDGLGECRTCRRRVMPGGRVVASTTTEEPT